MDAPARCGLRKGGRGSGVGEGLAARCYREGMPAVLAVLLLLAAVAVHKAGHAAAYRDLGIGRAVVRTVPRSGPAWSASRPPSARGASW